MSNSLKYKIIGDSCLDLTEELKRDPHFQMIPLTLQVDDVQIVDDETFDQADFLKRVAASPNCPKSYCPTFQENLTVSAASTPEGAVLFCWVMKNIPII